MATVTEAYTDLVANYFIVESYASISLADKIFRTTGAPSWCPPVKRALVRGNLWLVLDMKNKWHKFVITSKELEGWWENENSYRGDDLLD